MELNWASSSRHERRAPDMSAQTINDPNTQLIDKHGASIPTLSDRPHKDYRLDSYALALAPVGTACPLFTDLTDGASVGDQARADCWTVAGDTMSIQTITDMSLESLMYATGNYIRVEHAEVNWHETIEIGNRYSLVLAGLYELSRDAWVSRGVYIEVAEIIEIQESPRHLNYDLVVRFRVLDPDDVHYLDIDPPDEPPSIFP